jgi:hypothetical protein
VLCESPPHPFIAMAWLVWRGFPCMPTCNHHRGATWRCHVEGGGGGWWPRGTLAPLVWSHLGSASPQPPSRGRFLSGPRLWFCWLLAQILRENWPFFISLAKFALCFVLFVPFDYIFHCIHVYVLQNFDLPIHVEICQYE